METETRRVNGAGDWMKLNGHLFHEILALYFQSTKRTVHRERMTALKTFGLIGDTTSDSQDRLLNSEDK